MPRHSVALTTILAALAGCQSAPERVVVPEVVTVAVPEYVPVPDELTKPCVSSPLEDRRVASLVTAANNRKLCEDQLNKQLREIRNLTLPTPDLTGGPRRGIIKP